MNYKITKQYLKSEEQLIAAFYELNDARIFTAKKSVIDETEGNKLIYRIYDDFELVHVSNESNLFISQSEDPETYSNPQFLLKVMIKPADTLERKTIAYFNNKEDANLFIVGKSATETARSIDLFFIFKGDLLIETLNKNIIDHRAQRAEGSGGNEKGSKFRPTPLTSRPTPPGGPSDCWVEDDEDK